MRTSDIQREQAICEMYSRQRFTTTHIAKTFRLSRRRIQQIVKKHGIGRTQAEGNRVAAALKPKHRIRVKGVGW